MNKKILIGIIVAAVILFGVYKVLDYKRDIGVDGDPLYGDSAVENESETEDDDNEMTDTATVPTELPDTETTPDGTGTEQPPVMKVAGYTLADVAAHSTKENCWSAINGDVYDLTSWISKHPGGNAAIEQLCGKDGSSLFNGQHGGAAKQASVLATFKIGVLQ